MSIDHAFYDQLCLAQAEIQEHADIDSEMDNILEKYPLFKNPPKQLEEFIDVLSDYPGGNEEKDKQITDTYSSLSEIQRKIVIKMLEVKRKFEPECLSYENYINVFSALG
jgi:hypothetical protein